MPTIKRLEVVDWRYPTSLKLDGSDAVHKKPDYSCVYMVMHTDDPKLVGHGLTFTCGRGNEIVKRMIEAFEFLVVGKDLEKDFIADPVEFMRTLTQDGQLRWLGPEKGVIGLAVNCITNALWDMWARKENKPFWMLVATMEPEQLIKCIDFHHMTDCITPEEGLALLKKQRPGWEKRVEEIKQNGYPTYTTGAGWLGYSEEKTRGLCRDLMNEGFTHFKMKVGSEKVEDDMERAEWIRNEIGEKNVLMMDANQKWDVQTAISSMEKLAKFRPLWIEEPTHADDVCGHRDIARACEKFENKVGVATGEVAQNKVIFKQLITENAIEFAQIDAGRMSGGPSEILSVILMCLKKNVKVVPHAGGVGLCEYVRQYSFIDYICFSADMTGRLCEATAHLHEHFEEPIIFRNRPSDNMQCYMPNLTPGFGTMIRESIDDWAFPYGKHWNDVEKIGEDLDQWSKEMRLREQQRACEVLANYSLDSNADAKLKMAVAATKEAEAKAKKAEQEALASRELAASANTKMIGMLLGGLAAGMGAMCIWHKNK